MRTVVALVILLVVVAITFPQWIFSVDETQFAIVTRFGEPKRVLKRPGLKFKTPFVDSVTRLDKRLLRYDAVPADLLTKDKKTLHIDAYARYRIVDPLLFFQTVQNEQRANRRVGDLVDSALREEIAKDNQVDIIKTEREAIMKRVLAASVERATEFGIEIVDVRTKRIDFLSTIQGNIFARMQAERNRIAKGFRAEGEEQASKIRADVDRQKTIILADAQKEADILRGEGEAGAIEIFAKALARDPEFYAFQRSLEAYKVFFAQNTTVILSGDSDLFQYLESPAPPSTDSESELGPITTPTPPTIIEVGIQENPYFFEPSDITLEAGKSYRFINVAPSEFHTFTIEDLGIDVAIDGGTTVETDYTATHPPGTYRLVCLVHEAQGMVGTITIK